MIKEVPVARLERPTSQDHLPRRLGDGKKDGDSTGANQPPTQYKCDLLRRYILLPTTAGDAMKPSPKLDSLTKVYVLLGWITEILPSRLKK